MPTSPVRVVLIRTALVLGLALPAAADPVTTSTLGWAINGIVSEVARAGDVAYVGGSFGSVAPSSNLVYGFAAFSTSSATPVLPGLNINDRVRAVVALPGGGWLIGGDFSRINGDTHNRLARLLPDGTLDPSFTSSANGTVRALAVSAGKVYVGGSFGSVND
ncbi:MAG TPA: delta-60 repeat domain-containing protein, partial [Vicinamibacterales bacterium]|nr:delta-60 repeat domain-containing protein [Vicinamibacterales bacterium]